MTKREAVIRAIQHRDVRPIPYTVGFTQQEYARVAAYLQDPDFREKIGNYVDSAYYDGGARPIPERPGFFKDWFGVVWNRTGADKDIGVIERPVIPEPDPALIKLPPLDEPGLHALYGELERRQTDGFKLGMLGFTVFERAWTLCGMENLLVYMITDEDFVVRLLDAITEWNLRLLDIALSYQSDGFYFGDDWGQQRGLIMGPAHWRKYIGPCIQKLYARVKATGRFVAQHSCGDIHELFPDLIEMGLDVYQTFQPEIYDVEQVKRDYGDRLTFWGGISTQGILPAGTPLQVAEETARMLAVMGKGGGYIAAPTHAIPGDVPPENVVAMIDVLAGKGWCGTSRRTENHHEE